MAQIIKKFIGNNQVGAAQIRLENNTTLRARNAANSADVDILKLDATDKVVFSSLPQSATAPTTGNDLTNKTYVDTQDALRATKALDNLASTAVNVDINMNTHKLTALSAGSTAGDSVRYEQAILITGVNAFTANQPMGTHKLTGLSAGTTAGDSVRYEQAILTSGVNAFAADQSMGSHKLTNVTDPTNPQDAATKAYVDAGSGSGANTALSNLAAVAINTALNFGTGVAGLIGSANATGVASQAMDTYTGSASAGFNSGVMSMYTGNADASGAVNIFSGQASAGTSGNVHMYTGDSATTDSGSMILQTGVSTGGTRGSITLNTDVITSTAAAMTFTLFPINIQTDAGVAADSLPIALNSGTGNSGFNSGSVYVQSGGGDATGSVQMNSGDASVSDSGLVSVYSGGAPASGGSSGPVSVYSGNSDGASGNVIVSTGVSASGASGTLQLSTGNATAGNSGNLDIITGTAGGTRGEIGLIDGSEGTSGYVWTSVDTQGHGHWLPASSGGTYNKENLTLNGTDITNQYKDLAHLTIASSLDLVVSGLVQIEGSDYTLSTVGGVTRLTFAGDLATGGPAALISGDILHVKYVY